MMKKTWIYLLVVLLCTGMVTGCKKKTLDDVNSSEESTVAEDKESSEDKESTKKDDSSTDSNIEWKDEWGTTEETSSTTDKNTSDKNTPDKNTTDNNTTVEDKLEEKENTDVVETPEKEEIIWTKPVIQP